MNTLQLTDTQMTALQAFFEQYASNHRFALINDFCAECARTINTVDKDVLDEVEALTVNFRELLQAFDSVAALIMDKEVSTEVEA